MFGSPSTGAASGAAGIAPFCILSSPEDGNTWFLGPLRDPQPKLRLGRRWHGRLRHPCSLSLEVWDRNYVLGQAGETSALFLQ